MDVNEELKFLVKIHKKKSSGGGGSVAEGVRWGGIGLVGGGGQGGCERNVGGRGDVGYKKVLYNIKKMKNVGGAIFEPKTLSMYLKKEKEKKSKKKKI